MANSRTAGKTTRPVRSPDRTTRRIPGYASNPEEPEPAPTISHEEISACAYELFLTRGGQHGDDLADWFRAEMELRQEKNS